VKNWIDDDGTRYIVFLFKAEEYSGTLTSSSEGQVFWVEKDEVLNLPWIWGMDNIMRILVDREYSEFYMNAKNGWTPVMM
jgi:8-oxo-dGTP diphosphatase